MRFDYLVLITISIFSGYLYAEIPDWYKRDIVQHVQEADGVIHYKVKSLIKISTRDPYHTYRIDTETIKALKGTAPKGKCYLIHTEGVWETPYQTGEEAVVILNSQSQSECGTIEPGYAAPATSDYIELFISILAEIPKHKSQKK